MSTTDPLLDVAGAPAAHIRPSHPATVTGDGWVFSQMGRREGVVQQITLDEERLPEARAEIVELARERSFETVAWWTTRLTRPAGLGERLGLEPGEALRALALTRPVPGRGGFEVRRVETLDDFAAAQNLDAAANGWAPGDRESHAASWEQLRDFFMLWLALDDGEPVGMARAARADDALMLIGGATAPEARGRGVYRSLVAARWETAVALGKPALVVAANSQSAPILERLGFDHVGDIEVWVERL